MAENSKYYIGSKNVLVEVSREVYEEYHKIERHLDTLIEKDARHNTISYDALNIDTAETVLTYHDEKSVEDVAVERILTEKLLQCLNGLSPEEQAIINALYYKGLSERQFSVISGIPQKTINYRKRKILMKLKKLMTE